MAIERSQFEVAALDSAVLTPGAMSAFLRESELREATAIRHPGRRAEWMAGRVAAKYVFLTNERSSRSAGTDDLYLRTLTVEDLAGFGSEEYRAVSVVKDRTPGGGPARVGWSSGAENAQVSISHSAGISCASLGTAGVSSLDLETSKPRVPEFYVHTFTRRERDWVDACESSHGLQREWLFTLLWSARECLLKTPRFASMSLWNMPSLEVGIVEGMEGLSRVYDSKHLSGRFAFLRASTFRGPFRLAVAGTANMILTAMTHHE